MQSLSWLLHCLVLRALPGPLQEQRSTRSSGSSDDDDAREEAAPLRPSRPLPLPTYGSFKTCRNGLFCLVAALAMAVLIVLVMHLCLNDWQAPSLVPDGEDWQRMLIESIDNNSISDHLKHITKEPHVAGTPANFDTAQYVESLFKDYGLAAHHKDYDVLLSYPLHRSLVLSQPDHETIISFLKERAVPGDPYSSNSKVIPSFHGYAPSGNASAEVIYANYGRVEDFQKLSQLGVEVEGAIIIAKYGMIFRGDIVENAAVAGAVAVVIYSDPADYGHNGTQGYYPDSQWLPPSGVQRGSVFRGIGDPLTPGWVSESDAERLSVDDPEAEMPRIPSLPISAEDALPILKSLGGPVAPAEWQGALQLAEYKLGRGPGRLNFSFVANQTVTPIRNVFATIVGSQEPDRLVILGNHRDAWTFGAVDPNSGTAALLEVARVFGKLLEQGWRPRRSIVLCSWDAEEYGLVGSTEWVEQNIDILGSSAVAYINVDCAVAGPGFNVRATPQLDDLLLEITKKVTDPDDIGQTLYRSWLLSSKNKTTPFIGRLGGGDSDFAPFLQHAGVPSIDFFFSEDYPVYHSVFDDYNWMVKFGDPLFHRHVAVTSVWGLLALRLASDDILPLNYGTYAEELLSYALLIASRLSAAKVPESLSCDPLLSAIKNLQASVQQLAEELKTTQEGLKVQSGLASGLLHRRRELNDRLLRAERAFLDSSGIPGASWYKHLVYGPVTHNNYESLSFPGVWDTIYEATSNSNDAVSSKKWVAVQHEIFRAARVTARAALVLRGKLT